LAESLNRLDLPGNLTESICTSHNSS
jgi:hypothetical protein